MNKTLEKALLFVSCVGVGCEIGRTIQKIRICVNQKKLTKLEEERLRLLEEEEKAKQLAKAYEKAYEEAKKKIELAKENDMWTEEIRSLIKRSNLIVSQIESEQNVSFSEVEEL